MKKTRIVLASVLILTYTLVGGGVPVLKLN